MPVSDRHASLHPDDARYLDLVGAVTSSLCAIHCAATPLLAAFMPTIGLGMLEGEGAETALLLASSAVAILSIGPGFRRHRSIPVAAVAATGMVLLLLGHLAEGRGLESAGVVAIVAGGFAVACSHLLNRRLCRSCPECREARPGCKARLAPSFTLAPSGSAGGAISPFAGAPADPGADRRSASLTLIP